MKLLQSIPNSINIFLFVFLFGIVIIIFIMLLLKEKEKTKQKELDRNSLKLMYKEALKGNDKKYALECGRRFYSSHRKLGKLTIYDETALTNDLAAMDVKNN